MGLNRWLGCIENPRTGREADGIGLARTPARRTKVLIAGGGPAGLQAAIAAARNGHAATVHERTQAAGGQVRLAASVPNRAELGDLVRNQLIECRRLGVDVRYGSTVTPGLVDAEQPDHVIVATGAEPARPWWASSEHEWIVDCRAVLDGSVSPAGRVVVVDEIGFHHATSVAELLADRGCAVEIVTPAMVVGQDLGITLDMETWWMRASAKAVVQSTDLVPMGTTVDATTGARTINLLHHPTGQMHERSVDWVVLAVPAQPADELYRALLAVQGEAGTHTRFTLERIGDCVAPRRAHAAVIDGERVGAAL